MPERRIIRLLDGRARIVEDAWTCSRTARPGAARRRSDSPATALAQREGLPAAAPAGVWLSPTDEPAQAVALFARLN